MGSVREGVQEKRLQKLTVGSPSPGKGAVIVGKDGAEKQLPLDEARKFGAFERQEITLSIGDRIRSTKNVKHRRQKFLNNELPTVVSIDDSKITLNKGPIVRTGASLHLDQAIAVTGHASQAKTVDQSLPVCRFGPLARRTRPNSMSRCRVRRGLSVSLLIVRLLSGDAVARSSCQRSVKTSYFKESKTAPLDRGEIGSMGHVGCPQSEPANNDLQPGRSWMVAATNGETVRRYLRLAKPAISISITGSEEGADRKPAISIAGVGTGRRSRCESLAEVIGVKLEAGLSSPAYLPGSGRAKRLPRFLSIGPAFCSQA
jgi:hypothetical protein